MGKRKWHNNPKTKTVVDDTKGNVDLAGTDMSGTDEKSSGYAGGSDDSAPEWQEPGFERNDGSVPGTDSQTEAFTSFGAGEDMKEPDVSGEDKPAVEAAASGEDEANAEAAASAEDGPNAEAAASVEDGPIVEAAAPGEDEPAAESSASGEEGPTVEAAVSGEDEPDTETAASGEEESHEGTLSSEEGPGTEAGEETAANSGSEEDPAGFDTETGAEPGIMTEAGTESVPGTEEMAEGEPGSEPGTEFGSDTESEEEALADQSGASLSDSPDRPPRRHWWRPKNRKLVGLACLGAALIIAAVCFLFYYINARRAPVKVVETFLESIKTLDFETMSAQLENSDLSGIDVTDLAIDDYRDFYLKVNSKMKYTINDENFSLFDNNAKVFAHIRYIDSTMVYEATINEFVRNVLKSVFAGETPDEEQTRKTLAQILMQKSEELPEDYAETDITYNLNKTEDGWKIDALDGQTVKVMSSNYHNIEKEVEEAVQAQENVVGDTTQSGDGSLTNSEIRSDEASDRLPANPVVVDPLHADCEAYSLTFEDYRVGEDFTGDPCVLYYYTFTNKSEEPLSIVHTVSLTAFQNGKVLDSAIPNDMDEAQSNLYSIVEPDDSILVCQSFLLKKDTNVTIQANLPDGVTATQVLRVAE